ncbi:MAG: DUF2279 domain-containing protein [Ferruginibacter sp.]
MNLFFTRRTAQCGTSVASHSCTPAALLGFFFTAFILTTSFHSSAQDSSNLKNYAAANVDTPHFIFYTHKALSSDNILTEKQIHHRVKIIVAGNIIAYGTIMYGLNKTWYAGYPRTGFHTFNDNKEWLQVDKVGHMFSAYSESVAGIEMWRYTGIAGKKRFLYGGLSGAVYQTIIETLDGFSSQWGWSWGDFSANILGSGIVTAQQLGWNDQRVKLKFSFHKKDYGDAQLNQRANELFGSSFAERSLKDYNAQTYWASANIKSFFSQTKLPRWLSVAVGYGAEGMFGANENIGKDKLGNVNFDRRDIKRYRQWYLAPDVDFTRIKTNKKGIKYLFIFLSAFKFPTPSLELSNGSFKINGITF